MRTRGSIARFMVSMNPAAVGIRPYKGVCNLADSGLNGFLLGSVKDVLPLSVGNDSDLFEVTGWYQTDG